MNILLPVLAKACRHDIISMLRNAQSGHPGGSLSMIDMLVVLYATRIVHTNDIVVVSNGHTSPAVYSILAECGYVPKKDLIETFRKINSPYEGHVTRHAPGVYFGTGPLGCGISAAMGFALAEQKKQSGKLVFCFVGDGELQEGQVREAVNFAAKYKLENLIVLVDYNKVQLSGSLQTIMPIDVRGLFETAHRNVYECDGHNYEEIQKTLTQAIETKNTKPTVILGHTIMGKGVSFMEEVGKQYKSERHGKAPSIEQCDKALLELALTKEESDMVESFRKNLQKQENNQQKVVSVNTGSPRLYTTPIDCRTAYGNALADLAELNPHVVALTADLAESVKTSAVQKVRPDQHIECGIGEQNMVSVAGGLSLSGFVPFCSTFAAFMTSRAKDQARLNDINQTNVKMVATHAGLSVGEDGPTHQCIDDITSFMGLFNTAIIEPSDPNHTDHIIRYVAKEYGNFYVRMGRHKVAIITKPDGTPYYDASYQFVYGKSDLICEGKDITVIAIGSCVQEAFEAIRTIKKNYPDIHPQLIARSCPKVVDQTIVSCIQKTGYVLTVEDHNVKAGIGTMLASYLCRNNIAVKRFVSLGVGEYQLSGTQQELYAKVGIDAKGIEKSIREILLSKAS